MISGVSRTYDELEVGAVYRSRFGRTVLEADNVWFILLTIWRRGLFRVHMTGPGHVTLQTLPFSRTARRVLAAAGGGRDETGSGGILGGILGE